MRITEVRIDSFGTWRDLSLPLADSGISLIYGPNEAGKSTLMRFIRGMLYGFPPDQPSVGAQPTPESRTDFQLRPRSVGPWVPESVSRTDAHNSYLQTQRSTDPQTSSWKGALRIECDDGRGEIQRTARPGEHGALVITGFDGMTNVGSQPSARSPQLADGLLTRLLSSTSESVFRRLFSVDLQELHELATLDDDELAGFIYGLTLGPDGQRILDAADEIQQRRSGIFCADTQSGRLIDLLRRDDELSAEIRSAGALRDRHAAMLRHRDELATRIDEQKSRQSNLRQAQRGHRYLQQAWPIWNRMREIRAEIGVLPVLPNLPADGLERLAALEAEVESLTDHNKTLISEARRLREQARAIAAELTLSRHASSIRAHLDDRDRIAELNQLIADAEGHVDEASVAFDEALGRLGPEWSAERVQPTDLSPSAQCRLIESAGIYRSALAVRSRIRRRYKRRSIACRQQAAEWTARLKSRGHSSPDGLAAEAMRQLADIEELNRLRVQEAELEQRRVDLVERVAATGETSTLPRWTYLVLGLFGVVGFVCASFGLYTGLTENVVVGLMYAFLGATFGGTAYALGAHTENGAGDDEERIRDDLRDTEIRLRESREALARMASEGNDFPAQSGAPQFSAPDTESVRGTPRREAPGATPATAADAMSEFIARRARNLAEIEQLGQVRQQILNRRRQLGELRERLRSAGRNVNAARATWCEFLKRIGLDETVEIDEAFAAAQDVLEAKSAQQGLLSAQKVLGDHRRALEVIREPIARLALALGWHDLRDEDSLAVLNLWEEHLETENAQRAERRSLLRKSKARRREAAGVRRKVAKAKMRRAVLLAQAGIDALASGSRLTADDRREFERRVNSVASRRELEAALETASAELEAVSRDYPDLAVVEEDMLAFDPDQNAERLEEVSRELEEFESELQELFEQLGGVKREIAEAEADQTATRLRFDRARLRDRLRQTAEEWLVLTAAGRGVEAMRRQFERSHQPATLAAATKYLSRMTGGRYRNIWTPLDGHRARRSAPDTGSVRGTYDPAARHRLCVEDDQGRSFSVEQLSSGTREQLFLAIRLALVDEFRARGVELPMVLDDVLANFDQTRTEAAVDTLLDFASSGQQVLLLTCHLHLAQLFDSRGLNPIWLPASEPVVEERMAG